MPSIPQSLLWISLVVLWLFVLVPMLINKRDTVRRTSDVALATRVLNGGARSRLIKRRGPATGHRHDPEWQPDDELAAEFADQALQDEVADYDDAVREARLRGTRSVVVVAAVTEQVRVEPDYLDVDVVDENSGALPVGTGVQATLFDGGPDAADDESVSPAADSISESVVGEHEVPLAETDSTDPGPGDYEYVDDTSGLEAELEADEEPVTPIAPRSSRQRRMESSTAAAVSARKYRFRKRVLTAMSVLMVLTAGLAFTVSPGLWWACGTAAAITMLYLAYLRRQTRIEEQVRRRRQQRMARMRAAEFDDLDERGSEVDGVDFPTRLQRPGTVVLDIDDEDPIFEHLDEVAYSRPYDHRSGHRTGLGADPRDLPRAAGQ